MTTAELAVQFVALCREGRFINAVEKYYADDVVSVEAADYLGEGREMSGKEVVFSKKRRVDCR